MNNKIVWYIVGSVILIIIIIVFMMGGNKASAPQSENSLNQPAQTGAGGESLTMKELFSAGKTQTCTFNTSDNAATSAGTIYQTSGRLRGDFTSVSAGVTVASHMITDGKTMSVWTDGTTQGFTMSFDSIPQQANQSQSVNPDQKVDYKCNSWPVDQSKFSLPAGVTFSDLSALLNTNANADAGTNSSQCAVCNQAPNAEAKAQCKVALGCK